MLAELAAGLQARDRAGAGVAELRSGALDDVELVEGRDGRDVATFIDDCIRLNVIEGTALQSNLNFRASTSPPAARTGCSTSRKPARTVGVTGRAAAADEARPAAGPGRFEPHISAPIIVKYVSDLQLLGLL